MSCTQRRIREEQGWRTLCGQAPILHQGTNARTKVRIGLPRLVNLDPGVGNLYQKRPTDGPGLVLGSAPRSDILPVFSYCSSSRPVGGQINVRHSCVTLVVSRESARLTPSRDLTRLILSHEVVSDLVTAPLPCEESFAKATVCGAGGPMIQRLGSFVPRWSSKIAGLRRLGKPWRDATRGRRVELPRPATPAHRRTGQTAHLRGCRSQIGTRYVSTRTSYRREEDEWTKHGAPCWAHWEAGPGGTLDPCR